jgi:hypothetical protein
LPSQYLPTGLKLSIVGATPPTYSVELKGPSLVYRVRQFDPEAFDMREVDRTITPTASQWLRFWKAMDAAGVWGWRPSYTDTSVVDGTDWKVDIALGDRKIVSSGHGAYPADPADDDGDDDGSASEADGPFKTYLNAVEDLLGGARFR